MTTRGGQPARTSPRDALEIRDPRPERVGIAALTVSVSAEGHRNPSPACGGLLRVVGGRLVGSRPSASRPDTSGTSIGNDRFWRCPFHSLNSGSGASEQHGVVRTGEHRRVPNVTDPRALARRQSGGPTRDVAGRAASPPGRERGPARPFSLRSPPSRRVQSFRCRKALWPAAPVTQAAPGPASHPGAFGGAASKRPGTAVDRHRPAFCGERNGSAATGGAAGAVRGVGSGSSLSLPHPPGRAGSGRRARHRPIPARPCSPADSADPARFRRRRHPTPRMPGSHASPRRTDADVPAPPAGAGRRRRARRAPATTRTTRAAQWAGSSGRNGCGSSASSTSSTRDPP